MPIVRFVRERMRILVEKALALGARPVDCLFDVARFTGPVAELPPEPTIQQVRSFFRRLSKECGFVVSPHRFRHTLATEMMKSPDRNLTMVKGLPGHRSVATTMEYVEIDIEVTGKALSDIEAACAQDTILHVKRNL